MVKILTVNDVEGISLQHSKKKFDNAALLKKIILHAIDSYTIVCMCEHTRPHISVSYSKKSPTGKKTDILWQ